MVSNPDLPTNLLHPRPIPAFFVIADNVVGIGNEIAVGREIRHALPVVIGLAAVAVAARAEIMGAVLFWLTCRPGVNNAVGFYM